MDKDNELKATSALMSTAASLKSIDYALWVIGFFLALGLYVDHC